MTNDSTNKLEAILFYLAEPVNLDFLAKVLEVSKKEVLSAVGGLEKSLSQRGIRLVEHDESVSLVTAPEFSGLIEKIMKEEREKDLGRAAMETLSIVAYKGPVSRKDVEHIRGVNCQYALRNLLLRGLVEKKINPNDERVIMYNITLETLRYLGLSSVSDLPEYASAQKQLEVPDESTEDLENSINE